MEFNKNGKLIVKSLKKIIKHEEAFDEYDYYDDDLLVKYEED